VQPTAAGATSAPAPTEAAPPTAAPAATAAPAPTETPVVIAAPSLTPVVDQPTPAGGGTSVRPPDALVAAAQQRLAQHLGAPTSGLILQSANETRWPDGSLGCPKSGELYPQAVTPGFLLIFSNSGQIQTYEVHTGRSEQQMVLCENGQPTNLGEQASQAAETP